MSDPIHRPYLPPPDHGMRWVPNWQKVVDWMRIVVGLDYNEQPQAVIHLAAHLTDPVVLRSWWSQVPFVIQEEDDFWTV